MRNLARIVAIGAFGLFANSAFAAPMNSQGGTVFGLQPTDPQLHGGYPPIGQHAQYSPKVKALLGLREEGLRLREEDGGTLTEEHRAYLQQKLDAIRAEYPENNSADGK